MAAIIDNFCSEVLMLFKMLTLSALISASATASYASPVSISAVDIMCSGGAEKKVAVAVERLFPSGDLAISVAVNENVVVSQQPVELISKPDGITLGSNILMGYQSSSAKLEIKQPGSTAGKTKYKLSIENQNLEDLELSCKQY